MAKIVPFFVLFLLIIFIFLTGYYSAISIAIAFAIIVFISSFFLFIIYKILKIWKKKPEIGVLIGEECEAYEDIKKGKIGNVLFRNELWNAIAEEDIKKGEKLVVVGKNGYRLIVKKK
ncbi:MAG: NfeD family protein [Candidatus Thermoplasmatota archaeon]